MILGSATPALETRHVADRGELERLVLASRIGGRPMPAVVSAYCFGTSPPKRLPLPPARTRAAQLVMNTTVLKPIRN